MSLVRYEPWSLFSQLHGEVDRLFNTRPGQNGEDNDHLLSGSDWTPAVDIREEDSRYIIHADVPGVDPKDIEINMEGGVLSIRGERRLETTDEREGYKRVERVRGSFFRRFSMPDTADADAVTARSKDGVLEIVIPKQEKVLPKRIQVES
ncbi:MAG: Hsp20/alpha crystallin family protein [Gammaproteobacteria bacterium]|nr:MAG: Hsp20/alpha crystallin family protein [Gammaproteobacteria bacterium]